jgi:predicted DCC family thiol-disulfide oxidoreductase YuxK
MLTIFYDNRCPICLRTKSILERIDFGKQLSFIGIRNKDIFTTYKTLDEAKSLQRMASMQHNAIVYGFDSVFRIVRTLPLLWIFIPLFFVLKWTHIGEKVYDEIALKRKLLPASCDENCLLSE